MHTGRETYFRFDPPSDLFTKMDLAGYERGVEMEIIASVYIGEPETRRMIEKCARCIEGLPTSEDTSIP
jgi:hypothetical protein